MDFYARPRPLSTSVRYSDKYPVMNTVNINANVTVTMQNNALGILRISMYVIYFCAILSRTFCAYPLADLVGSMLSVFGSIIADKITDTSNIPENIKNAPPNPALL